MWSGHGEGKGLSVPSRSSLPPPTEIGLHSFRTRIIAAFVAVNLVVVALFGGIVSLSLSKRLRDRLDGELLAIARAQLPQTVVIVKGRLHVPVTLPIRVRRHPGRVIAVVDDGGRVVDRAGPHPQVSLPAFATTLDFVAQHHPELHTARFGGELFRFVVYPLPGPLGLEGAIVVGGPMEPVTSLLPRIFQLSLWAGLISSLVAGLLGWLLARSVVAPVEEIALTARQIGEHNLSVRMPSLAGNDELAVLAVSLNRMLDRLAHSLELQRRFLSDASHEIRTPLTILRGNLEVTLRRERSAAEYRGCLETLVGEVDHLEGLAQQLLWLARADAAGLELQPEEVAVDGWVTQVAERHRQAVAAVGGRLEIDATSGARAAIDTARMQQLLDNLLVNACRFTPEGGAVRLTARRDGGVSIAVEDDGPGVPEADREAVFRRFFRGDDARNRAHGGSGLGLAIGREIARAHGGEVWVEESPSGGARFVVRLPG